MTASSHLLRLASGACLVVTLSCLPGRTVLPSPAAISSQDYLDLKHGSSLRVLVPIYMPGSGADRAPASSARVQEAGNTLTLSAPDLLGYGIAVYRAQGKGDGRIRMRFDTAQTTIDGKTTTGLPEPPLPFPLPHGFQFVRLLYLVRVSGTDHNMALLAAREKTALDEATRRVQASGAACLSAGSTFCTWIPARVSVRPEEPPSPPAASGKQKK